ncbi:MAG: methyl-accepting chemotaxis protein [Gammaproteobacteria bacterium]|nr:methyl-accepting chemotaxis protein [Gammaproteobacteria bacterium]
MLRQIKIGKRLSVGFAALVLISIVVGLSAFYRLSEIQGNLNNIAERRLPAALLVGEMNREFLVSRIETVNWLSDANSSNSTSYQTRISQAQSAYDEAQKLAENFHKTAAGRATFEKVLTAKKQYDQLHKTLIAELSAGRAEAAIALRDDNFTKASDDVTQSLLALAEYQRETGKKQAAQAAESMRAAEVSIVISILVATILGTGFAIFITRSLVGPMNHAVYVSETIAKGNLAEHFKDESPDEAGALIRAMSTMQGQLRETITDINQSANQLGVTSEELHAVTDQSARIMQQQSLEVDLAVTAVTELTSAIEEVAQSAASTSNNSANADATARDGQQQVQQTIAAIQTLEQELKVSRSGIEQLSTRVNEIGSVLDVIRGIAEQTNLLALNAAIEAARAGDSGRGFAVVADEVRALAHRTQESTKVIEQTIRTLSAETAQTVAAMGQSSERATVTLELARKAGGALAQITSAISQISDQNMTIASAAEEQATVAREVDRNLVNIRDLSAQTATGADETRISSESLAELAEHLNMRVRQFKVS